MKNFELNLDEINQKNLFLILFRIVFRIVFRILFRILFRIVFRILFRIVFRGDFNAKSQTWCKSNKTYEGSRFGILACSHALH